jgi:hypothetical protein
LHTTTAAASATSSADNFKRYTAFSISWYTPTYHTVGIVAGVDGIVAMRHKDKHTGVGIHCRSAKTLIALVLLTLIIK